MQLLKTLGRIGQGAMKSLQKNRSMYNWDKIKTAYDRNMTLHRNETTHTLYVNNMHVRNGTRGNGMGMGHQFRQGKNK